jgi:ribulose-5-phosphate 4-epimerase/fuculose-1-phosphate aldolase
MFPAMRRRRKRRFTSHSTRNGRTVSCLLDVDQSNAIPPITPYVIMRVGRVPVVSYVRPGSEDIKPLIEAIAGDHAAALLQNHGPIVAGKSLEAAVFGIEELEEAAKLVILTRGMAVRHLDQTVIDDLDRHFKLK